MALQGPIMAERVSSTRSGRGRKFALAAFLLVILLGLLVFSTAPTIDRHRKPTAQDVGAAHALLEQIKAEQAVGTSAHVRLATSQVAALGILAGEASGVERVEAGIEGDLLVGRASLPVAGGLWINTAATVAGAHEGFPSVTLSIGRLVLPPAASRWLAESSRWWLTRNGVGLPPLDDLVPFLSVRAGTLTADFALPPGSDLVTRLVGTAAASVDEEQVVQTYCRLARAHEALPDPQLVALVQRAFEGATGTDTVEHNRAAFVALSFYVVGDEAFSLAPKAAAGVARCPPPHANVLLRGRRDLAKHWTYSAASTAVLGERAAINLGEWKELHDSSPSGSGFSFVDLAADRSGLHVALRALDPRSANLTAHTLRSVSEEELLPHVLTQAPEGLSDGDFITRFGGLGQERYRESVAWIDQHLKHSAH